MAGTLSLACFGGTIFSKLVARQHISTTRVGSVMYSWFLTIDHMTTGQSRIGNSSHAPVVTLFVQDFQLLSPQGVCCRVDNQLVIEEKTTPKFIALQDVLQMCQSWVGWGQCYINHNLKPSSVCKLGTMLSNIIIIIIA